MCSAFCIQTSSLVHSHDSFCVCDSTLHSDLLNFRFPFQHFTHISHAMAPTTVTTPSLHILTALSVVMVTSTSGTPSPTLTCLYFMPESLTILAPYWLWHILSHTVTQKAKSHFLLGYFILKLKHNTLTFLTPSLVTCNLRAAITVPPFKYALISSKVTPTGTP